jgi:hypothetical protein
MSPQCFRRPCPASTAWKTQVAIEYAYRNRSAYDVVWWIAADQPMLVQASLAVLGLHLGGCPSANGKACGFSR